MWLQYVSTHHGPQYVITSCDYDMWLHTPYSTICNYNMW